jgi:Flp pilus assembly protein TadG
VSYAETGRGHVTNKFRLFSLFSELGKDRLARSAGFLARLLRDEEGSYLLYVAVAFPVFLGLAAFATEGALIFYNHRNLQSTADSAAYSAAISYSIDGSSANAQTNAQAIVGSYGFVVGTGNNQVSVPTPQVITNCFGTTDTCIQVTATRPQLPILSSIWVNNPFNISATATAIIRGGGPGGGNGNCMLGLAPNGTDIALQGTPTISAPGCGIFSNSTGDCSGHGSSFNPSINLGGNGTITGGSVGAAGCISVTGSSSIGPPPDGFTSSDNKVINPYGGMTMPTAGSCIDGPGSGVTGNVSGVGVTATLNPGTYCNGISATVHASVTLSPGTYVFDTTTSTSSSASTLIVDSQSTLTGQGVTLMFTDPGGATYPKSQGTPSAMNISSGATIDLEAPTSGTYQGMLILSDSSIPTDTAFNLQANGTASSCTSGSSNCVGGVIYLPTADFTWQGGPILTGGCTQMIAYRVIMQGNAAFNNSGCNVSGGGGGGGTKPIGNVVTLVQ